MLSMFEGKEITTLSEFNKRDGTIQSSIFPAIYTVYCFDTTLGVSIILVTFSYPLRSR